MSVLVFLMQILEPELHPGKSGAVRNTTPNRKLLMFAFPLS